MNESIHGLFTAPGLTRRCPFREAGQWHKSGKAGDD